MKHTGIFISRLLACCKYLDGSLQRPGVSFRIFLFLALIALLLLTSCAGETTLVSLFLPTTTKVAFSTPTPQPPSLTPTPAPSSTGTVTPIPSSTPQPATSTPRPTPRPTSVPEPAGTAQIYKVHVGESLAFIAEKFSTSVPALRDANNLPESSKIHFGMELIIPAAADYQWRVVNYASPPEGAGSGGSQLTDENGPGYVVTRLPIECPAEQDPVPKGAELVGRSALCRLPIISYRLGQGETPLVLIGGIHGGYEWNTILLVEEMHAFLKENPNLIPLSLSLYLIPNANPDGLYAVTGSSGSSFDPPTDFKATIPGRFNGRFVDLNRNWDCEWQPEALWGSTPVNGGAAPFSEPETRALRDYLLEIQPAAVLFWHSAAVGVYPGGCGRTDPASRELGEVFGTAADYKVYDAFENYEISGDASNWLASEGIPAISVELTTHSDLDWEKNLAGLAALMNYLSDDAQS